MSLGMISFRSGSGCGDSAPGVSSEAGAPTDAFEDSVNAQPDAGLPHDLGTDVQLPTSDTVEADGGALGDAGADVELRLDAGIPSDAAGKVDIARTNGDAHPRGFATAGGRRPQPEARTSPTIYR